MDVSQLHEQHGYSQHSIQVQQIQVSEPTGTSQNTSQVNIRPVVIPIHPVELLICGQQAKLPYSISLSLSLCQVTGQPLSPASSQQTGQEMSPGQLTPVTLTQSHALQSPATQQGTVQHAYIPSNWNYRGYRK